MRLIYTLPSFRYVAIVVGILWMGGSIYGCAGLGKTLESPRISLAHISVQEFKAFETVFDLQLRIFNTNDTPLRIKALDCDLEVNGSRMATGVTDTETTIPALGSGLVDVTVYASSLQMVKRIFDGLKGGENGKSPGTLNYELSGHLHLKGWALPARIPFSDTGTVSLDQ